VDGSRSGWWFGYGYLEYPLVIKHNYGKSPFNGGFNQLNWLVVWNMLFFHIIPSAIENPTTINTGWGFGTMEFYDFQVSCE
jgi:hypothetical protein